MQSIIKIGTRESHLAVWQATQVKELLAQNGYTAELVYIKSEGDIDLKTPLYEMGVQGIFTRSLDTALLNKKIDIAVHSMKDVPTQLPAGIVQAAVLKRGNYKDLFVLNDTVFTKEDEAFYASLNATNFSSENINGISSKIIATSSTRRRAQWLNRYPGHQIDNLRGNVNTRLKKVAESNWHGAIFAAAGLERVNLRPANAVELDWMLPAPAQGAVMVVCNEGEKSLLDACIQLNDVPTAICTKMERDFLRKLLGGCTTPISALAEIDGNEIYFRGSILSLNGQQKVEIEKRVLIEQTENIGRQMAVEILNNGGKEIADAIRNKQ